MFSINSIVNLAMPTNNSHNYNGVNQSRFAFFQCLIVLEFGAKITFRLCENN